MYFHEINEIMNPNLSVFASIVEFFSAFELSYIKSRLRWVIVEVPNDKLDIVFDRWFLESFCGNYRKLQKKKEKSKGNFRT